MTAADNQRVTITVDEDNPSKKTRAVEENPQVNHDDSVSNEENIVNGVVAAVAVATPTTVTAAPGIDNVNDDNEDFSFSRDYASPPPRKKQALSSSLSSPAGNNNNEEDRNDNDVEMATTTTTTTTATADKKTMVMSPIDLTVSPYFPSTTTPNSNSNNNNQDDDEVDSGVFIIDREPVAVAAAVADRGDDSNNDHDNDNDELQIVSSNVVNPNIHLPHKRPDCDVYKFSTDDPAKFCDNCYCVVCDVPARDCRLWDVDEHAMHCVEVPKVTKSRHEDFEILDSPTATTAAQAATAAAALSRDALRNYLTTHATTVPRPTEHEFFAALLQRQEHELELQRHYQRQQTTRNNNNNNIMMMHDDDIDDDDIDIDIEDDMMNSRNINPITKELQKVLSIRGHRMRITEVLGIKLRIELEFDEGSRNETKQSKTTTTTTTTKTKTEKKENPGSDALLQVNDMAGDLPKLALNSFYVEGVKIGWPFPSVLLPQRQMAMHIIKALKRRLHTVLESPTGTGKSAAILCSVLAWQKYYMQTATDNDEKNFIWNTRSDKKVPKIIYCSRTHSQVAQMVASLKKTPYRPKMTVLGSREKLCIHEELTGPNKSSKVPLSIACQARRKNTERERKALLSTHSYDDNSPHTQRRGDGKYIPRSELPPGEVYSPPTCPHYRNLTSKQTAQMVAKRFVGSQRGTTCCSVGEGTAFGVHDLEDLISFGKNPYLEKNVTVYRGEDSKFGLAILKNKDPVSGKQIPGIHVHSVTGNGGAKVESRLKDGDRILEMNEKNARMWNMAQFLNELKAIPQDKPLRLSVLRANADTPSLLQDTEEVPSDHSSCPYYLSRGLHAISDLTFAPYNYILDPGIRRVMNIDLDNSVVVLDEAHNIESVLCESGSTKCGEIELCQFIRLLVPWARRSEKTMKIDIIGSEEKEDSAKVAHDLLIFVENLLFHLHGKRQAFEKSTQLEKLQMEYERYHNIPDDHEIELSYDGPTGYGRKGVPSGCKSLFDELRITEQECSRLLNRCESLESAMFGNKEDSESQPDPSQSNTMSSFVGLLSKFVTGKLKVCSLQQMLQYVYSKPNFSLHSC
jgi:Rad3-related DNA helicase